MSDEQQEIKKERRGGFRPGAGRPPGIPQRPAQKNASRVHLIKKRLIDHSLGKVRMQPSEVRAAEVVLDRHEPRLASIEQTNIDPRDQASPAEIAARLAAMFDAKPELLEQVLAIRAAAKESRDATSAGIAPH